jgi:hypothetical protein
MDVIYDILNFHFREKFFCFFFFTFYIDASMNKKKTQRQLINDNFT